MLLPPCCSRIARLAPLEACEISPLPPEAKRATTCDGGELGQLDRTRVAEVDTLTRGPLGLAEWASAAPFRNGAGSCCRALASIIASLGRPPQCGSPIRRAGRKAPARLHKSRPGRPHGRAHRNWPSGPCGRARMKVVEGARAAARQQRPAPVHGPHLLVPSAPLAFSLPVARHSRHQDVAQVSTQPSLIGPALMIREAQARWSERLAAEAEAAPNAAAASGVNRQEVSLACGRLGHRRAPLSHCRRRRGHAGDLIWLHQHVLASSRWAAPIELKSVTTPDVVLVAGPVRKRPDILLLFA